MGNRLILDGFDTFPIKRISLNDSSITAFDTTPFPNLNSLLIDENVKLDSLIINNSQLTEFSYNSSDLVKLLLINNTLMTKFVNSNLPELKNLTVIKTPLS